MSKLPRRPRRVDLEEIIPINMSGTDSQPNSEPDKDSELRRPDYAATNDENDEDLEEFLEFIEEIAVYDLPEPREDVEVGETGLSEEEVLQIHDASVQAMLQQARGQGRHEDAIDAITEKTAFTDGTKRELGTAVGELHEIVGSIKQSSQEQAKAWAMGSLKLYAAHRGIVGLTETLADIPGQVDFTKDDVDAIFEELQTSREEGDPLIDAADNDVDEFQMDNTDSDFAKALSEYETEVRKDDLMGSAAADGNSNTTDMEPEPQTPVDEQSAD